MDIKIEERNEERRQKLPTKKKKKKKQKKTKKIELSLAQVVEILEFSMYC